MNGIGVKLRSGSRLALTLIFLLGTCWSAYAQQPASDDYRVYEAVLRLINSIPKPDPHVTIFDRTLSSRCDAGSDNPVFANGCSFFWVRPDTDQAVEQMLRKRWRGLDKSTWKNFKAANASSITLHDPIATPFKHRIVGPETTVEASQEWESPDMALYFSRVGFNTKKTEAIVYVLAFSYVGRMTATGDYLHFRMGPDGAWTLAGRVRYMIKEDDVFASAETPHLPKAGKYAPPSEATPQLRAVTESN